MDGFFADIQEYEGAYHALENIHIPLTKELLHSHLYGEKYVSIGMNHLMIQALKITAVDSFDANCDARFYTSNFHLLAHLVDDGSRFGSIYYLDTSPYKPSNKQIKKLENIDDVSKMVEEKATRIILILIST